MKKFENVDVIDTLRKIMLHNTRHYQTDFEYDIRMLTGAVQSNAAGQSFLWMSRDCGTWCFPERDVYICNTDAHYTWQYYSYLDSVRAFRVDLHGVKNGIVDGNIVELDYANHVEDVKRNSHLADSIEVVFCNPDNVRTFEIVEYNERRRSIQARYGAAVKETYIVPDENALNHMLKTTRDFHFKKAKPTNVEDYIRDMERDYFHSRGYKTGDMAFIIPSDVYDAIKHGIAVYALYPQNVAEQIATTKEFDNLSMKSSLFGIRHEDKPLLDYLIQRPSLKSELFTRDEYKELFSIALQTGKSNGLDMTDKKTLDSIINKLDKIVFAVGNSDYEIKQDFAKESEGEYEPEE